MKIRERTSMGKGFGEKSQLLVNDKGHVVPRSIVDEEYVQPESKLVEGTKPKKDEAETFIRAYDNILPEESLDFIINLIEERPQWVERVEDQKSDHQFLMDPFFRDVCNEISELLVNKCLKKYVKEFPTMKGLKWMSGATILQKTEPTQGYHMFHCENMEWDAKERVLAWMIYLNDIEEGGETEFLYQSMRIKPVKNTALIWPAGFTHTHRGNPPLKETKYVLTGWLTPCNNIRVYKAS